MSQQNALSPLEHEIMQVIWSRGPCSAEDVRYALAGSRDLKESTVRTLLRRMEEKKFVTHEVSGRTYIYRPEAPPVQAAIGAVRQIINRFCGGSVEALLVGMVDNQLLDSDQLQELADKIAKSDPERNGHE